MNIQNIGNPTPASPPVSHTSGKRVESANVEPKVAVELPKDSDSAKNTASSEQINAAVSNINQAMRLSNRNLQFSVDPDTKLSVVKLTDTETGEVIRQFPSEEALAIAHSIDQFQKGLLLRQQA